MREQEHTKVQLSVIQIIAGALASVSAAVVASTFGLKGTLLGAAMTSIVASVGGALYTHSLHRAHVRIRTRLNPHTGRIERIVIPPQRVRRPIRWGMVVGGAGLVFLVTMGAITVMELAAHKPVAVLVGHAASEHGGTTVGALIQSAPGSAPIAMPTMPTGTTAGSAITATPNGTPPTSATPGGTPTVPLNGTPSISAPTQAAAKTVSATTVARSVTTTPTIAAHTPTVSARMTTTTTPTGATPTPQATAAKSILSTTAPIASAQAVTPEGSTPHGSASP